MSVDGFSNKFRVPSFDPKVLRKHVLRMALKGQSVHVACAFSLVEIVAVLYGRLLRFDQANPNAIERDYLVLSKGHGVMALYACFYELGWLRDRDLDNYFRDGTLLRGLCESGVPGCEVTSGSLGHGLPIATGIAYGLQRKARTQRVYCIVGDGEMNEGSMWESLLFAAHHKLENLTVVVDANQFQAMGRTEDVLGLEPLSAKFQSFGWNTVECDGHASDSLENAFKSLASQPGKPAALIARTTKGYGVSFMAGDNSWHYRRLDDEIYGKAVAELSDA
jgi:transketolase